MKKQANNNNKASKQLKFNFSSVSNTKNVSSNSNKVVSINYYEELRRKE
ncbi:MAG: hypothetical protein JRJ49_06385, partial [Deltaproteobacteria bacterium]|nr:hypothetical protein [Deltaproteobacteria bacterium]